jgi:hypothetical protein
MLLSEENARKVATRYINQFLVTWRGIPYVYADSLKQSFREELKREPTPDEVLQVGETIKQISEDEGYRNCIDLLTMPHGRLDGILIHRVSHR